MSWSCQFGPVKIRDLAEALSEKNSGTAFVGEPDGMPEAREEQFAAARHAVLELAASGIVGDADTWVMGNLYGHANPHHQPLPGWADDDVTVNIRQTRAPEASE